MFADYEIEDMFVKSDLNHDNKLFYSELVLFFKNNGMEVTPEHLKKEIKEFDESGDEYLELPEFIKLVHKLFPWCRDLISIVNIILSK